jgi:alpha-L-rhamnosidase
MLGNGSYYVLPVKERYRELKSAFGYSKLICRLALDYADGSHEDVVSHQTWRTAAGPFTFSSTHGSEDYNAGLKQAGWATAAFNAQERYRLLLACLLTIHTAQCWAGWQRCA